MGDPEPAFGCARIMEVLLQERYPAVKFEVINAAITAINSHVILPIARDCSKHMGDFWVIYMGNNEVIGPFGPGTVFGAQTPSLAFIRTVISLKTTHLGQLAANLWYRLGENRSAPKSWGGMEMFIQQQVRSTDPRMSKTYSYFEQNLRDMIQLGKKSRIILSSVASNLKDCAPFGSLNRADITATELAGWEKHYSQGKEFESKTNFLAAIKEYEMAQQIDPTHADLAYRHGRCLLALGKSVEARKQFIIARDEDTLRFRADSKINGIIHKIADANPGIIHVDADQEINRRSPEGIAGSDMLYEHVHPTFEGNYWIARLWAEAILKQLPSSIGTGNNKEWLNVEACSHAMALTEWDRFTAIEMMTKRMSAPPFTHQSNWAEQQHYWQGQLEKLRPFSKPYAMKRLVEKYREAVSRRPNDFYLHGNFARLLQAQGEDDAAIKQWQATLQLCPHNALALYSLADILDGTGKNTEAETFFTQALAVRAEFPEALNGLGLCLATQKKFTDAVKCFQKAIQLNPEFAEGYVNLGQLYSSMGENQKAIIHYQKALNVKTNSAAAHINLGKLFAQQGKSEEALNHYTQAVQFAPEDPIAHYNLANTLAGGNRSQEAIMHYQEAIKLRSAFWEARVNLGLELARIGKTEEALNQFSEVVKNNPANVDAQFNAGVACARLKKFGDAIRYFQEALRLEPNNTQVQQSLEAAKRLLNTAP